MTIRWGNVYGHTWALRAWRGEKVLEWGLPGDDPFSLRRKRLHSEHAMAMHGLFHLLRGLTR